MALKQTTTYHAVKGFCLIEGHGGLRMRTSLLPIILRLSHASLFVNLIISQLANL